MAEATKLEMTFFVTGDSKVSTVVIEPWAEEVKISAGERVKIFVESPIEGISMDVRVEDGRVTLWGWPGSTMYISKV